MRHKPFSRLQYQAAALFISQSCGRYVYVSLEKLIANQSMLTSERARLAPGEGSRGLGDNGLLEMTTSCSGWRREKQMAGT